MSNRRRKSLQCSFYLERWLKKKALEKAIESGKTFSSYIRHLINRDLGYPSEEEVKDIVITLLEDGTLLYGIKEGNS